jgi:CRISPR-associated DxTHG motif protein
MIILSMIGISDYKVTSYAWGDRVAKPCHLVQQALAEWFPEATLLVCATQKAKEKYGQEIESIPNARPVDIPDGKNEAEYWEMFNKIEQEIPPGTELVLDITHGFRSLPILALLAVSFLRAAKQVQVKHVLYGAFDASHNGSTPMFDLTPFLTMLDWAIATNRFLETGYTSALANVAKDDAKAFELAKALEGFSIAMQLHDPVAAGQRAKNALDQLETNLEGPLDLLKDQLTQALRPMAFSSEDDKKQLIAIFNQIDWYKRHSHYEKATGLAKEWLYLFARWKSGKKIWPDGEKFSLNEFLKKPENEALRDIYDQIKAQRDKMSHWRGIPTEGAGDGSTIFDFDTLTRPLDDLRNIVIGMGLELPEIL